MRSKTLCLCGTVWDGLALVGGGLKFSYAKNTNTRIAVGYRICIYNFLCTSFHHIHPNLQNVLLFGDAYLMGRGLDKLTST